MTREEAVAIIRKEYSCVGRDCDIERSCGKCDLVMPSKEPILEAYKMAIKALEQEPRWIPVSERLPKESEYVGNVCKYYLIQDEYGDMHVAHYNKIGWIPIHSLKALGDEVMAWMPLPEPYKGESEEV